VEAGAETSAPGDGSTSTLDTWHPAQIDAGAPDASAFDASVSDVSASDTAVPDAPGATTLDAGGSSVDASDADAGPPDAPPDAMTAPPLQLCGMLDSDWGIATDAAVCASMTPSSCPDRASYWASPIQFDYASAVSSDCRISQMFSMLSMSQTTDYLNALIPFTLDFFGCPQPDADAGAVTFGLVPEPLWSTVFTTTDLQTLSDAYAAAVSQALSDQAAPPLTTAQTDAINARLQALAATVPGTVVSTSRMYDTCATEAGAEGGDDGGNALDGGVDGTSD
jgi:hypothetical protein